jgi:imidazoleglycerol phosphate dehydratase HisB
MGSPDRVTDQARVRVSLDGSGESNVSSGLPVLDTCWGLLARYGALDLELQLAPEEPEARSRRPAGRSARRSASR